MARLHGPTDLAVGPGDDVYVTDSYNDRVVVDSTADGEAEDLRTHLNRQQVGGVDHT